MIAESIELAKKQQEAQGGELTHSELALFDDVEAENSAAVPTPEVFSLTASILPSFTKVLTIVAVFPD